MKLTFHRPKLELILKWDVTGVELLSTPPLAKHNSFSYQYVIDPSKGGWKMALLIHIKFFFLLTHSTHLHQLPFLYLFQLISFAFCFIKKFNLHFTFHTSNLLLPSSPFFNFPFPNIYIHYVSLFASKSDI